MTDPPRLHHVVFAVARERQDAAGKLFTELGFTLNDIDLEHLGLRVLLDWDRGIELISPGPESDAEVATSVSQFLADHGSDRLPNPRCSETPSWRPFLGMSGPARLQLEFDLPDR